MDLYSVLQLVVLVLCHAALLLRFSCHDFSNVSNLQLVRFYLK